MRSSWQVTAAKNKSGIVLATVHDLRCEVSFCKAACYVYVVSCQARTAGVGKLEKKHGREMDWSTIQKIACSHRS